MLSKLKFDIDAESGNPFILVEKSNSVDDVRDKIASMFFEKLGHKSIWLKAEIVGVDKGTVTYYITPISPDKLKEECLKMNED